MQWGYRLKNHFCYLCIHPARYLYQILLTQLFSLEIKVHSSTSCAAYLTENILIYNIVLKYYISVTTLSIITKPKQYFNTILKGLLFRIYKLGDWNNNNCPSIYSILLAYSCSQQLSRTDISHPSPWSPPQSAPVALSVVISYSHVAPPNQRSDLPASVH